MTKESIKVIIDTNIWISFLIGKRLSKIQQFISDGTITIVVTTQLLTEIKTVTQRTKIKKYFPKESVNDLIELLTTIAEILKQNHCTSSAVIQKTIFSLT